MEMTIPLGSHLVTPRTGYHHHGIHVGEGRVAHYAGYRCTLRRGPVEIVDLAAFAGDTGFWIATDRSVRFSGAEIARRALARVGEDRYSLLQNNCEHFCAWCITGEAYSAQVESLLDWPRLVWSTVVPAVRDALAQWVRIPHGLRPSH